MDLATYLEPKTILELGAYGVMLFLFVFDRVVTQPKRDSTTATQVADIVKEFREERKEDRDFMERTFNKLSDAIEKLSDQIHDIEHKEG